MKMISAGAGLGFGVKDYRVVFVFDNDKALAQILESGWSSSVQTMTIISRPNRREFAHRGPSEQADRFDGLKQE